MVKGYLDGNRRKFYTYLASQKRTRYNFKIGLVICLYNFKVSSFPCFFFDTLLCLYFARFVFCILTLEFRFYLRRLNQELHIALIESLYNFYPYNIVAFIEISFLNFCVVIISISCPNILAPRPVSSPILFYPFISFKAYIYIRRIFDRIA